MLVDNVLPPKDEVERPKLTCGNQEVSRKCEKTTEDQTKDKNHVSEIEESTPMNKDFKVQGL